MSNVTPTSYDDLRNRNRQDYDRTQPNKMAYRYIIWILYSY